MRLEDLPTRWSTNLDKYLKRPESKYSRLSLADFTTNLRIQFEDNSKAEFQFAFYLKDIALREVAVFTEHCGYHIFPFCISRIDTIDSYGNIINSENAVFD